MNETIAAIATPLGVGGVGIVRVSGEDAIPVADKLFRGSVSLCDVPTHTLHLGDIVSKDGLVLDRALVSVMRAPRSFTGENVAEINCHGGPLVLRKVLGALLESGARLAEPGEFSKRAFLNGKMDLSEAEAVISLIHANSEGALLEATGQLRGSLSEKISSLRERLLSLLSHLEAAADFPEEDITPPSDDEAEKILSEAYDEMEGLLKTASYGRVLREGVRTAIVGRPNVGKSSLLNALLEENRAIVADIPGTTRDVIEETVNLGEFSLLMMDTAGVRETKDQIEAIGVQKSLEAVKSADLVLWLLDQSEPLSEEDWALVPHLEGKNTILVLNKADLAPAFSLEEGQKLLPGAPMVSLSVRTGEGISGLIDMIKEKVFSGKGQKEDVVLTRLRHQERLLEASAHVKESLAALHGGLPMDLLAIDLSGAVEALGEITGQSVSEEVVDRIFHDFCLGK